MKKILILQTGGTFGMVPTQPHRALAPAKIADQINRRLPEIKELAEIEYRELFNLDSSNMQSRHWQVLAKEIHKNLSNFDGFVIIHGTDSMVYTATALSFMLRNLPVPVILTGAQRPFLEIRSDARTNLINSVELATCSIPEVAIFFGTRLYRGNRTVKVSGTNFAAFDSPNYPPLAEVGLDVELFGNCLRPNGRAKLLPEISDRVIALPFFPSLNPDYLQWLPESPFDAVVLEGLGLGNMAVQDKSMVPLIKDLTGRGKMVVITSQNLQGKVDLSRYENGRRLQEAGAIGSGNMTTETAIVKLMHLLGVHHGNIDAVKKDFLTPLAGELN